MRKGWQVKTLGEIAEVKGGKRLPKGYQLQSEPTDHPYITVSDFTDDGSIDMSKLEYVSDEVFEHIKRYTISSKDLYLSIAGTIGKTGYVPSELDGANLTENACKLVLYPGTDRDFLHYFTKSADFIEQAGANTRTAAQPKLALERLKTIRLCIPQLPEQRRIVGLLDEVFAGLVTAKANAEKNLQNARALFESHLQSVFTQRVNGWKPTKLGDEIDLLAGFAFKSAQYTTKEKDIRLLRGDNIIQGCLRWDDVKRWPANDTKEYERYQLQEGDVVLAMDRPWVKAGLKHATIAADDLPCLLVQRTARLRGGANLDNRFLKLLIGSSAFTRHILGVQTGIGVPHISGDQIKDFAFGRPPLADQRRVADNLESLREETQRLAMLCERKLAALEALKKSLLHEAFTGEL